MSTNAPVPQFLIHSYRYYVMDAPVLGDETFDHLARELIGRWESLVHPHKGLIDPSFGKSGFYIKEAEYPGVVVACAEGWERMLGALSSPGAGRGRLVSLSGKAQ